MSLFTHEIGPSNAPTILFLHGGGGAGWMWQPQIEALKEQYHLLIPDLPEHGESLNIKPFTIKFAAEQVAELIQMRAHGGQAYVVGLSLGAQVLVALLSLAPTVVNRAIISSALLRPAPGAWLYTPTLIRWTYKTSIAPFKKMDWWIDLNSKYAAGIPFTYYPQARADFRCLTEEAWVHIMLENLHFRLPAGLEKVTTPTLVVAGAGEYPAMKQSVHDLVAVLPQAQGNFVTHSKNLTLAQQHNWNLNTPDLFTHTVQAWFKNQLLPPELKPLN